MFFSPLSIAITPLGEERTNLSACPLGELEGLWLEIVALSGLFFNHFFFYCWHCMYLHVCPGICNLFFFFFFFFFFCFE